VCDRCHSTEVPGRGLYCRRCREAVYRELGRALHDQEAVAEWEKITCRHGQDCPRRCPRCQLHTDRGGVCRFCQLEEAGVSLHHSPPPGRGEPEVVQHGRSRTLVSSGAFRIRQVYDWGGSHREATA
jgi:hypothetical protein